MPKEHGHLREWSAHSISKNAKDKNNRDTLRASQDGIPRKQSGNGDISNHMLFSDSEKDSGYSEVGSGSVHTDVDDQHSGESGTGSDNSVTATSHSTLSYEELTPIFIIKHLVVKPTSGYPPDMAANQLRSNKRRYIGWIVKV